MPEKSVREVMTANPTTIAPDLTVLDAAQQMTSEDVGSLPVVDESGSLVGMITDRDTVVRVVAEGRDPQATRVDDACSASPVTIDPDDDLDQARELMEKHQVRRVPVVEGGRLVGILAQADVAREAANVEAGQMVEEISR